MGGSGVSALIHLNAGSPVATLSAQALETLVEVLPEAWREHGQEALVLATQLRDVGHGRLHPELEALRAKLTPRGATPGA